MKQDEVIDNANQSLQESEHEIEMKIHMERFDRENYAKTITKLNRVMIENESLKEKIELQS